MPRRAPPRGDRRGGFVLVEVLVATAIVGVALLFALGLLAQEQRLEGRARAERQALVALESALEGLRAGVLPLATATYAEAQPPFVALPGGRGDRLWIEVAPAVLPDLYDVTVTVRFRSGPALVTRSLATRIWRPGG